MKNLLITLPMFLILGACGKDDEDTGADDSFSVDEGASDDDGGDGGDDGDAGGTSGGGTDGGGSFDVDAAWAAPACDYSGVVCMALTGAAFAGAPLADICAQFDGAYSEQLGGVASTPVEGCPQSGANGACQLPGPDGQDQVWFSWPTFDGAGSCSANGGTYVAL